MRKIIAFGSTFFLLYVVYYSGYANVVGILVIYSEQIFPRNVKNITGTPKKGTYVGSKTNREKGNRREESDTCLSE